MMDMVTAVETFLEQVDRLTRLPLITDAEMGTLFGREVVSAVEVLNRHNREKDVCRRCESRCCQACHCELYAPQFSRCPIQDLRPVLCRLHFCSWFGEAGGQLVKELGDIFCESLLAADRDGNARVRLFESPPLAMSAPGLVAVTVPWVEAVRDGRMDAESAEKAVRREAEKYRTPVGAGAVGD